MVGFICEIIERVLDAEALYRRRRGGSRNLWATLDGVPLLNGMGQFVGKEFLAFARTGLILIAKKKI